MAHLPVLTAAVVGGLAVLSDGIYVDCTFGRGGHAVEILNRLGPQGRLLVLDRDPEAVAYAHHLAAGEARMSVEHASFEGVESIVTERAMLGQVHGMLFDLGVSSPQLDDAARGFSFLRDGPLDMRMDPSQGAPIADWLNTAELGDIARVLIRYGEERHARRIATRIGEARARAPLTHTSELAALVSQAYPARERHGPRHPATQTFQALRIQANDELGCLQAVLPQALRCLAPGGRLVVVSFHSLEDRIVKRFMRNQSRPDQGPRDLPIPNVGLRAPFARVLKPVRPAGSERFENPRARSAILRIAVKDE